MTIHYQGHGVTLHHGDCLDVLRTLPDASVDSVVTDPPYGLEFMGKDWDAPWKAEGAHWREASRLPGSHSTNPTPRPQNFGTAGKPFQDWCEQWARECLRVLKPGGHMLAFGGTRTWHRLACAVEDAGFEVRDSIAWMYGCLSDDTEILTSEGWVRYDRAKEGQHALAFDTATGALAWQAIQHVHRYPYAGEMVRLHSEHTDQLLTPNHRVVLDEGRSTPHTPYVPSDQDLRRLLADVPGARPLPVGAEADVLAGVRGSADLAAEEGQGKASLGAGRPHGAVRDVRDGDVEAGRLAQADRGGVLLEPVQRRAPGGGVGEALPQGQGGLDRRQPGVLSGEDDRAEQPRMEGRRYRVQEARELRRSALRASAGMGATDGPQGRVHHGAPATDGRPLRVPADPAGSHQPREPRPQGQPTGEPDPLALEPSAQALRVGEDGGGRLLPSTGVTADVVDYAGVVWCITVPHGAFIARRNGLIFATGNSGFPKSLDVSKAIDKAAGAERETTSARTVAADRWTSEGRAALDRGESSYSLHDTDPATPDAERWQGWGTALKPSFEGVVCAVKPVPPLARIGSRLDELEQSCRPPASSAAPSSAPTPHDSPEARTATAPASAATQPGDEPARLTPTGAAAGSSAATATSASESTVGTFSSTVTSWKACWAELCEATSTSTTATRSSTTTDLETLWSCLSQITPESTMTDPTNPDGLSSLVGAVDAMFAAAVLNSRATRTLTAIESATSGTPLTSPAAEGSRPAFEPVVVARKPLAGTVAGNVLAWGTGALNVDGCRIGTGGEKIHVVQSDPRKRQSSSVRVSPQDDVAAFRAAQAASIERTNTLGRWPANVVLDESQAAALDEQSGKSQSRIGKPRGADSGEGWGMTATGAEYDDLGGASRFFFVASHDKGDTSALTGKGGRIESCETASTAAESSSPPRQFGDSALGGAVTSEHPDTASQTGSPSTSATPSGSRPSGRPATPTTQNIDAESSPEQQPGERTPTASPASSVGPSAPTVTTTTTTSPSTSAGSAAPATSDTTSQWKALGDTDSAPFKYVAKADATERPRVNGTAHPTVKPLSLMRWLVRLVTPPGGTVLEPFAGSGTTVEACIVEGFDCIAIEKGEEYLPLIMQRIHRRRDPVAAIRQTGDELGLFELDGEGA